MAPPSERHGDRWSIHGRLLQTPHDNGAVEMQVGIEHGAEAIDKGHCPEASTGAPGLRLESVLDRFEEDPQNRRERRLMVEEIAQALGQGQEPLSYWDLGNHAFHQMRGGLRHAPDVARGTGLPDKARRGPVLESDRRYQRLFRRIGLPRRRSACFRASRRDRRAPGSVLAPRRPGMWPNGRWRRCFRCESRGSAQRILLYPAPGPWLLSWHRCSG